MGSNTERRRRENGPRDFADQVDFAGPDDLQDLDEFAERRNGQRHLLKNKASMRLAAARTRTATL